MDFLVDCRSLKKAMAGGLYCMISVCSLREEGLSGCSVPTGAERLHLSKFLREF